MTRPFHIITNNPVDAHALLEESQRRDAIEYYERLARQAKRVRFVEFISSQQFMVGVFVGSWFTVAAAFVVAFL